MGECGGPEQMRWVHSWSFSPLFLSLLSFPGVPTSYPLSRPTTHRDTRVKGKGDSAQGRRQLDRRRESHPDLLRPRLPGAQTHLEPVGRQRKGPSSDPPQLEPASKGHAWFFSSSGGPGEGGSLQSLRPQMRPGNHGAQHGSSFPQIHQPDKSLSLLPGQKAPQGERG